MPSIILKKTFKVKPSGLTVSNEKSFSFHGGAVNKELIALINGILSKLHYSGTANKPVFQWDGLRGHYKTPINHDCQKHHEEDIIVAILDAMEGLGWAFRFQYDAETSSVRVGGSSASSREVFIFQKGRHRNVPITNTQEQEPEPAVIVIACEEERGSGGTCSI
jgi:hypothetical protein